MEDFFLWAKERGYELPEEGQVWKTKFSIDMTEDVVRNPDYTGLTCGRIELWDGGDFPREEYHVCLPHEIWEDYENAL